MEIIVKKPEKLNSVQLEDFESFVLAGGEVIAAELSSRIRNAEYLVLLSLDGSLAGIGAIKNPSTSYRQSISKKTDFSLDPALFPYELGWVFVTPSARGRGLSRNIVEKAIAHVKGVGVFSTTRTKNTPMHHTLEHCGFERKGHTYKSNRDEYCLQLFILAS